MSNAALYVTVTNAGGAYTPDKGTVELDLKLRDTASGDQWRWIYEEELDALAADATQRIDIDPFLFTSPDIDEIEACLTVDDLESDGGNNCLTASITVSQPEKPGGPVWVCSSTASASSSNGCRSANCWRG